MSAPGAAKSTCLPRQASSRTLRARIHRGDADDIRIRRGIQRRRRRAVAYCRNDDMTPRNHEPHDVFEQHILRPDQTHVDDGDMLARDPCNGVDDCICRAPRAQAAVDIGGEQLRTGRGARERIGLADEQRCDGRTVCAGNRLTFTPVLMNRRPPEDGMRDIDAAIDQTDFERRSARANRGARFARGNTGARALAYPSTIEINMVVVIGALRSRPRKRASARRVVMPSGARSTITRESNPSSTCSRAT